MTAVQAVALVLILIALGAALSLTALAVSLVALDALADGCVSDVATGLRIDGGPLAMSPGRGWSARWTKPETTTRSGGSSREVPGPPSDAAIDRILA